LRKKSYWVLFVKALGGWVGKDAVTLNITYLQHSMTYLKIVHCLRVKNCLLYFIQGCWSYLTGYVLQHLREMLLRMKTDLLFFNFGVNLPLGNTRNIGDKNIFWKRFCFFRKLFWKIFVHEKILFFLGNYLEDEKFCFARKKLLRTATNTYSEKKKIWVVCEHELSVTPSWFCYFCGFAILKKKEKGFNFFGMKNFYEVLKKNWEKILVFLGNYFGKYLWWKDFVFNLKKNSYL